MDGGFQPSQQPDSNSPDRLNTTGQAGKCTEAALIGRACRTQSTQAKSNASNLGLLTSVAREPGMIFRLTVVPAPLHGAMLFYIFGRSRLRPANIIPCNKSTPITTSKPFIAGEMLSIRSTIKVRGTKMAKAKPAISLRTPEKSPVSKNRMYPQNWISGYASQLFHDRLTATDTHTKAQHDIRSSQFVDTFLVTPRHTATSNST